MRSAIAPPHSRMVDQVDPIDRQPRKLQFMAEFRNGIAFASNFCGMLLCLLTYFQHLELEVLYMLFCNSDRMAEFTQPSLHLT